AVTASSSSRTRTASSVSGTSGKYLQNDLNGSRGGVDARPVELLADCPQPLAGGLVAQRARYSDLVELLGAQSAGGRLRGFEGQGGVERRRGVGRQRAA